jgi:hypothetical protein
MLLIHDITAALAIANTTSAALNPNKAHGANETIWRLFQ